MPATASTSTAVPGMPPFRPAKKMRKFCGWRLVVICPRRRVRALHRGNSHRGWLGRVRDVTFVVCASRFGVLAFAVVSAIRFCFCFCFCFLPFAFAFAGIRELLAYFTRRPCAGRHLLFFAAAKKSRQKKAAHTASSSVCLRAPTGSYTSHGNHVTHIRCQRSCRAPHPLRPPELHHPPPDIPPPPRWQTVCRP